ncbi:MAG: glycosyltransferase family 2 protein [Lachnospiraceae bacterium]|nr:glycosyltransferase family 2 protein [Lachnospiraceae bacterium]
MGNESMISVIVPIYNVAPYLKKCLDSILYQTYRELEIILVDDGSTDGSSNICDEYQKKDERIIVVHQPNGGPSVSRNAGLDIAKGDFIAFVDSDDWIHKDYFKSLIRYTQVKGINIDIVQCGVIKTNKEQISDSAKIEAGGRIYNGHSATGMLYEPGGLVYGVIWGKLYRKHLLAYLRFPVGRKTEDEFINYRLLFEANYVINLNFRMYFYRQRKGSLMSLLQKNYNFDIFDAYDERIIFFKQKRNQILYQKTVENYYKLLIIMSKKYQLRSKDMINLKKKHLFSMLSCNNISMSQKIEFIKFVFGF